MIPDGALATILRQLAAPTVGTGHRHALLRLGERDPIIPLKRRIIYERDGFRCLWCQIPDRALQLDHIRPWSNFPLGTDPAVADRSDNLRTLCEPCNLNRSNLVWSGWRRVLPVVKCCWSCKQDQLLQWTYRSDPEPLPEEGVVLAYCGECGMDSYALQRWVL